MADIELVIKIPEELLEYFASHNCMSEDGWFSHSSKLLDAFRNGIQLPKGHGDLIDRDDILADSYCIDDWSGNEVNIVDVMTVIMADAIIEAESEG